MTAPTGDNLPGTPNIAANRSAQKWTPTELARRALWEYCGGFIFSVVPRPLWGIRRSILRAFGARIGRGAHIFPSVKIALPCNIEIGEMASVGDSVILYSLGRITIGPSATVSQGSHLCAGSHDYRRSDFPLVKASIAVGGGAWICADAFIGPGVTIGELAVVGARAVAVRDVAAGEVVAGNPARRIGTRTLD
jgi:putative colanic acid biosynthesis acetyltransferase WcaF